MTKFDNDPENDSIEAPYLKLFSSATTNGRKVGIFLELLKIPYTFRHIKDFRKDTKEQWFLDLNPVARIPVLSDVNAKGEVFNLAESGAILTYLAEKYDTEHKFSYPTTDNRHWKELEFVFFHVTTVAVVSTKFGVTRTQESKDAVLALYQLIEDQLKDNGTGFLVGDHFSLAEAVSLAHVHQFYEHIDYDSYKNFKELKKWYDRLINLPEVQAAYHKTD